MTRTRQALSDWPALVLTAGLATRLQPLSSFRAKAALPVAGTPLIVRILRWLRESGVRRVVLNLHHRAESITRVVGDGTPLDLHVRYSWETDVLGSAGGPARAIPMLESDRFLIVNGDTLADVDLAGLTAQHLATNAMVTMAVVEGDPRYNAIIANEAGVVTALPRRLPGTNRTTGTLGAAGRFHFIGVQAANVSTFAGVSPDLRSETVHGFFPQLIAARPEAVRVFRTTAEFFDIGTPRDYLDTAITLAAREQRPLDRGRDCLVDATATLTNTILWDRVSIGAGVKLNDCVVADDVTVPAGAEFSTCSLVMRDNKVTATPF